MNRTAKNLLSFVILLTLTFLLASCSGDEGPAGPTGPAGPSGEDADFTTLMVSFTGTEGGVTGPMTIYNVAVPEITQEVLDNGAVLFYMNESMADPINDEWILVPFSIEFSGITYSFTASVEPGAANFIFTTTDVDWLWTADTVYTYKIVILTEPVKSGVNVENFEDVRTHYQDRLLERE